MFKDYNSLPNYLIRNTIISYSRLHIRLHTIISEDKTPFLHNHPFYFISIILKNGYEEECLVNGDVKLKKHRFGSIIFRTPNDFHRIKKLYGETKTFFITWKVPIKWRLKKHPNLSIDGLKLPETNGVYLRNIKGCEKYCKYDSFWFIGHNTIESAMNEDRLSIHQCMEFKELNEIKYE